MPAVADVRAKPNVMRCSSDEVCRSRVLGEAHMNVLKRLLMHERSHIDLVLAAVQRPRQPGHQEASRK